MNIDTFVNQLNSTIVTDYSRTTIEDQKRFICKYADSLSKEKKMQIGSVIDSGGYREAIKKFNEGTSIDLDQIDNEVIINTVYNIVYYDVGQRAN